MIIVIFLQRKTVLSATDEITRAVGIWQYQEGRSRDRVTLVSITPWKISPDQNYRRSVRFNSTWVLTYIDIEIKTVVRIIK